MYDLKKSVKKKILSKNCDVIEIFLIATNWPILIINKVIYQTVKELTKIMHFQPRNQSSLILYYNYYSPFF